MTTGEKHCLKRVAAVISVSVLAAIIVALVIIKTNTSSGDEFPPSSASLLGHYGKAAISANAPECARIGREVLEKGGNVADSAIAILLCVGVMHSESMGLGGGFFMVYYNKTEGKSYTLNSREVAPAAATFDMFEGNSTWSATGALAVAVLGELKGYWEMYKRFGGGVPWESLFLPTIEICEKGYVVDAHTAGALIERRNEIMREPSMAEIFIDPITNEVYQLGDTVYRPQYAKTLRRISKDSINGGDLLYQRDSELAQWLVEDLEELGGIMTMEDLENYKANWLESIHANITGGFQLHTMPPPGSGVLIAFILRALNKYDLKPIHPGTNDQQVVETIHLIAEAFKHAYAKRTILGDPFDEEITAVVEELVHNLTESKDYLDSINEKIKLHSTSNNWEDYGADFSTLEDHGTSHISIIGPNGDAISVTSSINAHFGANIRSKRTGIIYNNQMDDFSAPNIVNSYGVSPSPNNFIKPAKRPLSSMSPSIITDAAGDVRLVVGAAGGTMIPTSMAYVILNNIKFNESIKEAIDAPRFHHQLVPMELKMENGLLESWAQGLEFVGHSVKHVATISSRVMGVSKSENGSLWANCDFRVPCSVDGF